MARVEAEEGLSPAYKEQPGTCLPLPQPEIIKQNISIYSYNYIYPLNKGEILLQIIYLHDEILWYFQKLAI